MCEDELQMFGPRPERPLMRYLSQPDDVQTAFESCPICLSDHAVDPETTTCGHVFCGECLERALAVRRVCPVCRRPQEGDSTSTGSDNEGVIHQHAANRSRPRSIRQ